MGRKGTSLEVQERRDAVALQLKTGAWSLAIVRELADRYAVLPREIQRDRKKVEQAWKRDLRNVDREKEAARIWQEVRAFRVAIAGLSVATRDGKLAAVAERLFALEMKILGLDEPIKVEVTMEQTADPAALAGELLAGLPMIAELLGIDESRIGLLLEEIGINQVHPQQSVIDVTEDGAQP